MGALLARAEAPAVTEIYLPELAKELKPKEIRDRLESAYGKAFASFSKIMDKNAKEHTISFKSRSAEEIGQWATKIDESPKYLSITCEIKWLAPKEYQERLQNAASMHVPAMLKEVAEIVRESGGKITISLGIKAVVNEKTKDKLNDQKTEFAEKVSNIIVAGLKGEVSTPYPLEIGDPKTASRFAQVLQEAVGLNKPESAEGIAFEKAKLRKGQLPIEVSQSDSTINIGWASWIAIGAQKTELSLLVPKKVKIA